MLWRNFRRVLETVALAFVALPAQSALLYGIQYGNPNLVTVDSATGAINNVGLLPAGSQTLDPVQGLTGIAGGFLLYTDGTFLDGVHRLNPATGALIATTPLPGVVFRGGLSFDTPNNRLFTVNNGSPVASQSPLGGAVDLNFIPGASPYYPGAIGGDDNGRHFASLLLSTGAGGIFEFDPLTGALLNSFPFPENLISSGLAFDGQFLYASDTSSGLLFTLDPDTGAILNTVGYEGGALTALAVLPVPEPTTLALLGLGLAGLAATRRRKQ